MDLQVRPADKTLEPSVKESDVAKANESTRVEVQSRSRFFDAKRIVHCEFLPKDQTINQHFYRDTVTFALFSAQEETRVVAK